MKLLNTSSTWKGKGSWCCWQRHAAGFGEICSHRPDSIRPAVFEVVSLFGYGCLRRIFSRNASIKPFRMQMSPSMACQSVVWYLCPKEGFASKETVETSVALSVVRFNDCAVRQGEVVREMGCTVGEHVAAGLQQEDRKRVYHVEKKISVRGEEE